MNPRSRWLALCLAGGVVLGLTMAGLAPAPRTGQQLELLAVERILPEFTLHSVAGVISRDDLATGQWHLLVFGYSHCPDVCPTTLVELAQLLELAEDIPLAALFVSVDPARDSPRGLAEYVNFFSPRITGATGGISSLTALASALGVRFEVRELPGGEPPDPVSVSHTNIIALIDPRGRFRGRLRPGFDPLAAAGELRLMAGESG